MAAYSVEAFLDLLGEDVIVKFDFLVTGDVTECGFRAAVKRMADNMNLRGFVANTKTGKVMGSAEGTYESVMNFKTWLAFTGPPRAHIANVSFTNETWHTGKFQLKEGPFNVVYVY